MSTWRQWLERNPAGRGEIYHSEFDIDLDKPWDEPKPITFVQSTSQDEETRSRPKSQLLSTKQAARYLAISPWSLRNLVNAGRLRYLPGKRWKLRIADLDKFLEQNVETKEAL